MCGITGFWDSHNSSDQREHILRCMTGVIQHRGPDGHGAWFDESVGLALGHRRLSIVDLSIAGHQPMASNSGRYILVYNGEIYNHRELRSSLSNSGSSVRWSGHSDTEVVLAAFDRWGIHATLKQLNGMFAFAVWDRERQVLTLARDRMGEKPLYYGVMQKSFLFGSELKSLTTHPSFSTQIDRHALTSFFRYNYIPAPLSIWQGISKLPAATYIEVSDAGKIISEPQPYWNFREVAIRGVSHPLPEGPELADQLEVLLKDAIRLRMDADVPLGAFLSGGIDSSVIVALMQEQSSRPVQTFTIGSSNPQFNEAGHAQAVSNHLGTQHTAVFVGGEEALATIPKLPFIWDEPFADSSQIPTLLVNQLARRHVSVSLTGDGGDELFGGYNRYVKGMTLWNLSSKLPLPSRRILVRGLQSSGLARRAAALMWLLPPRYRMLDLAARLPKIGELLAQKTPDEVYERLVAQCVDPGSIVLDGLDFNFGRDDCPEFEDFRQQMMYRDTKTYLADDIMVKLDRASMSVSLEGRVPFLDHRLVEFAWRLPMSSKINGGVGKKILREILHRRVPKQLTERPKMGFAVPVGDWLRGPLREWAEALLNPTRLETEGLLSVTRVREIWSNHLAGNEGNIQTVWALLMFQAWLESQGGAFRGMVDWQQQHGQKIE